MRAEMVIIDFKNVKLNWFKFNYIGHIDLEESNILFIIKWADFSRETF